MQCLLRMRSRANLSSALVGSLVAVLLTAAAVGCGSKSETGTTASNRASSLSPSNDAKAILERMVDVYANATRYSDEARIRLRYRQHGKPFEDEAPLAVRRDGNQLEVHAYLATVICDGDSLFAQIQDEASRNIDGQVLVRTAPARLTLDAVYHDPVLRDALTSGLGRQPVQLELLLGEQPLESLMRDETEKRIIPSKEFEGHACFRVEAKTAEGAFVFWIDESNYVLRRLDYPAMEMLPDLAKADQVRNAELSAEFRHARINEAVDDASFRFEVPDDAKQVHAFVLPPQPLPSPLLGKRPSPFHFTQGNAPSISRDSLSGSVAVLAWFNNHPACRATLGRLNEVSKSYQNRGVAIHAVCTEPTSVSNQQLEQLARAWEIDLPMSRDLQAFGRDLFQIPWAPTVLVLDKKGVVQFFEVGANPQLDQMLPVVLDRLLEGNDLAAEVVALHEQERAAYQRMLAAAQESETTLIDVRRGLQLAPSTRPTVIQLVKHWVRELERPGNLTPIEDAGTNTRLLAVDAGQRIVELDEAGVVQRQHKVDLGNVTYVHTTATGPRRYVVGAMYGPQVAVFDEQWNLVLEYPSSVENPVPIFDAQFADVDRDGTIEMVVGFMGRTGIHCVRLDGHVLWQTEVGQAPLSVVMATDPPTSLLVSGEQGFVARIGDDGTLQEPVRGRERNIFHLFAASGHARGYCGLTYDPTGGLVAVGLSGQLAEQWDYRLPRGSFEEPVEFVACGRDDSGQLRWAIAAPDGTIHLLSGDGSLIDRFGYGDRITGIAITKIAGRQTLLVSAGTQVTAWRFAE